MKGSKKRRMKQNHIHIKERREKTEERKLIKGKKDRY